VLVALGFFSTLASAGPIAFYVQGGILPNAPSYLWDYGCSPTSAGMMMGYYDVNGYGGLRYDNLVPGGQAEPSTWPYPPSRSPQADSVIASAGHIADFYGGDTNRGNDNYLASGDDVTGPFHAFDSLADFMGSSQDSIGNVNGSTTFYYFTDGTRLTAEDAYTYGIWNADGMYGIWEYLDYAGYTAPRGNFFTQLIDSQGPYGMSFTEYMGFIDAGNVVMIQVAGHSMFGYGYDTGNIVYFYDTWNNAQHSMIWGGSYAGLDHWGVTVFEPAGGSAAVPEPGSLFLLGTGLVGLGRAWRKRRG